MTAPREAEIATMSASAFPAASDRQKRIADLAHVAADELHLVLERRNAGAQFADVVIECARHGVGFSQSRSCAPSAWNAHCGAGERAREIGPEGVSAMM